MGFFDFFSSSSKQKSYEKYGDILKKIVTTKEQRTEAIEALEKIPAEQAIPQLLKRFEMVTDSGLQDNREKEQCMEIIVKHGDKAKDFVREVIQKKRRVAWPVKIAEKIFSTDDYIALLLENLNANRIVFDEETLERNEEILLALKEVKDVRIVQGVSGFLTNRDEHVRMAALECLAEQATEFEDAKQVILNLASETITDENSRFIGLVNSIIKKNSWI